MRSIVYANEWFSVVRDGQWHFIREKNSDNGAVILMVEDGERFIFLETYRKAVDTILLELPRGYGEPGETSREAAVREAYEETGYRLEEKRIKKLGSIYPNSAILSSKIDIYYAEVQSGERELGTDEETLSLVKIHCSNLDTMVKKGLIADAFSLAALSLFRLEKGGVGLWCG